MYLFKSLCILTKKSALFLCIVQIIIWVSSKSKMQLWGSLTENIYDGVNWCQKIFHHLFLLFKVGLAGSSAIVTATLKCLMHFFNLTETDLPKEVQPQFILDVEKSELHINAGKSQCSKNPQKIREINFHIRKSAKKLMPVNFRDWLDF